MSEALEKHRREFPLKMPQTGTTKHALDQIPMHLRSMTNCPR